MKKAFTLLETLIVIVIIGILAVVLVESYTTVSGIAFRIQQEKHLSEESLMLTQMLQSISDTAAIDYEKYDGGLEKTFGFTETLYLT
jgi:prepilin-type N-terminal cleavage/methylation domain-containing protein